MTTSPSDRLVAPTLLLQPIGSLPAPASPRADALGAYLTTTKSWARHPVALSGSASAALWIVLVGAGSVGGWLVAVRAGGATCSGVACSVATLGHPGLMLLLAGTCVVTLLGVVPFTRGLTRAGGPELAAMTVGGVAGAVSLLGVVVLVVLLVAAVFVACAGIVAVFERN